MEKTARQDDSCRSIHRAIWDTLTDGTPVVVTSHERLDGDGLGSALALWHGLRNEEYETVLRVPPPVPEVFDYLPGVEERLRDLAHLPSRFHLVVIDCGSLARTGKLAEYANRADTIINIDHHGTHSQFGQLNLIRESASSSGELLYEVLEHAGVPITREIAGCLYTAILTDTGRFSYSNTNQAAFDICARLVHEGADAPRISERIYYSPPARVVRLKGLTISSLQLEDNGRIATCQITRETFRNTGTRPVDTQGFADIPISVAGVESSALFKELPPEYNPEYIKVSLRSRPSIDSVNVCAVAESFGGGGHRHAAGCELEGPLEEARKRVVDLLSQHLKAYHDKPS
ncbi:MAG: DHH family phosphoesterase [Planctomycetota bacterium]